MNFVPLQGKPFTITVIQACAPTTNAEEAEWFYEDLQYLLELTSKKKKKSPFHHRGLECKSRKSRVTLSNCQIWPQSTKWSRAKANRVLPGGHTGHSQHPLPTTQETTLHMDITRLSTPKSDWLYSLQPKMEKFYTVSKNKTRNWLWLRSWTPYCQFRLKLKKLGKSTRPFRYDQDQIPYDYTVAVRNRFKRLDLVDRVPDELWTEVRDTV